MWGHFPPVCVNLKSDAPITDLEKARWYIEREIARLKAVKP